MNLKTILEWTLARPELAIVVAGAIVTAITSAYAAVKIAYQRVTGRVAKGGAWTVLDVAVELLPNVPGALNRLLRAGGSRSIFAPSATEAPPSPSKVPASIAPREGERGTVRVSVMLSLSGAILAGAVLAGCPAVREGVMRVTPGVPDPSGCAEGAQRCSGSVPEVCSATHRWWPALPRRADGTQRVCAAGCAVTDAGVAVCIAVDGGAP